MKTRSTDLRVVLLCALAAQLFLLAPLALKAAEPDLLGSLELLADSEVATILELPPEVRQSIAKLKLERTEAGRRLREESPASNRLDRAALIAWRQESERLALELLTAEQRQGLMQLILARDGLASLQRDDVQAALELDAKQKQSIEQLLDERVETLARLTPLRRRIAAAGFERKLQSLLTAAQLVQWERLAGGDIAVLKPKQPEPATKAKEQPQPTPDVQLTFAFERTPWREVVDWLAEEASLSLYVGSMPPGSFTYSDQRVYTPDQAVARINRFLLPLGYTLVRSGRMLSVIGLEDSRRDQLLDSLAEYAELSEIDRRGDNEVVKCVFTLKVIDPKIALEEIRTLVKLSTPVVLAKSKQIMVIETAAKIRIIRDTIEALDQIDPDSGPIRQFQLKFVTADKVLAAARPLIGIADPAANVGEGINVASADDGKRILATGTKEKLDVLAGVVDMLDLSPATAQDAEDAVLRAHPVEGVALQAVDDVLQTLLEGKDVRLAQEPGSNRLIVLATEEIHQQVEATIAKLQSETSIFDVIQLQRVDAYIAVGLIREMLDIPFFTDDEKDSKDHPRIDWDPRSRRIFIRGSRSQVDAIKEIVARLEEPQESKKNSTLRLLPIQGEEAAKLLETGKRFWPDEDKMLIFPPSNDDGPNDVLEREINGDAPLTPSRTRRPSEPRTAPSKSTRATTSKQTRSAPQPHDHLTSFVGAQDNGPPASRIKAQVTPRGILLQSDDVELLNRFESHLRTIAGPNAFSDSRMAIFYLKFVGAEEAKSLLNDVRRGGDTLDDSDTYDTEDSDRPRRYYSYSIPSIIADARLNRLIVQGTMAEIMQIEKHLKIIDRENSIADVQIRGKSRVIALQHIRASEAADIVRQAFASELAIAAPQPKAPTQQQQKQQQQQLQLQVAQQQQPAQPARTTGSRAAPEAGSEKAKGGAKEGERKQGAAAAPQPVASTGQQTRTAPPKMSLAINVTSNSLIIRAPEQLFREVEELIRLIDKSATQTTRVMSLRGMNPEQLKRLLLNTIGNGAKGQASPRPSPRPSPPPAPQPAINSPAVQTILLPSRG